MALRTVSALHGMLCTTQRHWKCTAENGAVTPDMGREYGGPEGRMLVEYMINQMEGC